MHGWETGGGTAPAGVLLPLRVLGAALLGTTAEIHLHLWSSGYRGIAWIGPLFLADAVLGATLAPAVLLAPARWSPWACLAGALLQLGTLAGLWLSVTVGLLGFVETWAAPWAVTSVVVEALGCVVLGAVAGGQLAGSRHGGTRG
jgi:hypothetical protein